MATQTTLMRSASGFSSLDPDAVLPAVPAGEIAISGNLVNGEVIKIRAGAGVNFGPNAEFWARVTTNGTSAGSTLEMEDGVSYRVGRRAVMAGYASPLYHRPVHAVPELPWGKGIAIGSLDEPPTIAEANDNPDASANSSITFIFNDAVTAFNSSVYFYPRANAENVVADAVTVPPLQFDKFNIKEDWFGNTAGGANNGIEVDFYARTVVNYFGGATFQGCNGLTSNTIGSTNMALTALDPASPTVPLDCPIVSQKYVQLGVEGSVKVTLIADRSDGGEPYLGTDTQFDNYWHDYPGNSNKINRVQFPGYCRGFQPFMEYNYYTSEKYYSEKPNRVELCNQLALGNGTRKVSLFTPIYWSPSEIWAIVEAGMFYETLDFEGSGLALRIFDASDEFVTGTIL